MRSPNALARHALAYPGRYASALRVRRRLRNLPDDMTHADALEFARGLSWRGDRLYPTQATAEILWLLDLLEELGPRTVVEIGTYEGGTLFLWTRVAAADALLVAVDTRPLGPLGQMSPYAFARRPIARQNQRVELVMPADSHAQPTLDRVRALLGGRPVDFLFIDGDHSYEGVKRDFELWSPSVRPGGVIALHDVAPHQLHGVPRFWTELREGLDTEERVAVGEARFYGIGVIHVR